VATTEKAAAVPSWTETLAGGVAIRGFWRTVSVASRLRVVRPLLTATEKVARWSSGVTGGV
jgi:hypothetical protein